MSFFINSCAASDCAKSNQAKKTEPNYHSMVTKLAEEKYAGFFTLQENETKEFYLVTSRSKSATETAIKFFIYEKESELIILEDFIPLGDVKWNGKFTVNVQKFPGTVKLNETGTDRSGYVFNVKTKQKI